MKKLFFVLAFFLAGCAGNNVVNGPNTGAASSSLADARVALADAQAQLKLSKPDLNAVSKDLQAAQQSHLAVQSDLRKIQADGDAQAKALTKAQRDEAYYRAIAENNVKLLLAALLLGGIVFALGEYGKNAEPYTALLPGVVAGMLATMIFAVVACSVYELWGTLSWLFHLL